MSEWKPDDVAMVSLDGEGMVAVRGHSLWADRWFVGGPKRGSQHGWRDESLDAVRPLVVIDAEDEDALRLLGELLEAQGRGYDSDSWLDLQAALREFAKPTPPKHERPTGLGAVVRDSTNVEFVHLGSDLWTYGTTDGPASSFTWDELDAVEVLSQGWSE